jgi:hypothetical protein
MFPGVALLPVPARPETEALKRPYGIVMLDVLLKVVVFRNAEPIQLFNRSVCKGIYTKIHC